MSRNVARNLNMSKRYSDYERLKFDYPEERILRITIDRPERLNALDAVGHREITYVWQEIDKDPDVDCVILTGRGKAFSAGGDFEMIEGIIDDFEQRVATWKEARGPSIQRDQLWQADRIRNQWGGGGSGARGRFVE